MFCLDPEIKINNLSEEKNKNVLKVLNDNCLFGLDYYTTERVCSQVNDFAEGISANVEIQGVSIKFGPKN